MIRLTDFSIGYGSRMLICGANTEFSAGKLTALIGRNGSGKSTLLRAIAGLNNRYSGAIYAGGTDISTLKPSQIARTLAFVTTERIRIPNMRCGDIVAMGRAPYTNWIGALTDADRKIACESLDAVGMAGYRERTMDTMSDGECQRIMIARALAQDTPVILLDEPTSFLDMPGRYELAGLLGRLAHDRGKCIVFSTHELDIALRMFDNVALVADGTIYNMTASEMESSDVLDRLFGSADSCYRK